jgi:hypothetical protein
MVFIAGARVWLPWVPRCQSEAPEVTATQGRYPKLPLPPTSGDNPILLQDLVHVPLALL